MQNYYFDEIDSTNNWIKRNLVLIPETGLLWVTAGSQTHGRGQHGRSWISQKDQGLWTSFAYWNVNPSETPLSLQIAGKIIPILEGYRLQPSVKPPNDILINGKKLCGILCETAWFEDKQACIVGIGINVASSPQHVDQATTCLHDEGVMITAQELLKDLQKNCDC